MNQKVYSMIGDLPSLSEGYALWSYREEGIAMVSYDGLFQFTMLIVTIIGLTYKISSKKK